VRYLLVPISALEGIFFRYGVKQIKDNLRYIKPGTRSPVGAV